MLVKIPKAHNAVAEGGWYGRSDYGILNSSVLTGITVCNNMSHHCKQGVVFQAATSIWKALTVDGNRHGLCQFVSIFADKARHSTKFVDLEIIVGDTNFLVWVGLDDFEIDFVGLGYSTNCCRAGIALHKDSMISYLIQILQHEVLTYVEGIEFPKHHDCRSYVVCYSKSTKSNVV